MNWYRYDSKEQRTLDDSYSVRLINRTGNRWYAVTRLADQKCIWTCMGLRDAKKKAQEIAEAGAAVIDYAEKSSWRCVTGEDDQFDRYACGSYTLTSDWGEEVGIWFSGSMIGLENSLATAKAFVTGYAAGRA